MLMFNRIFAVKRVVWNTLRSPRAIATLKLAAAVVGVVHAIDELTSSSTVGKSPIGFRPRTSEDDVEES